jgi:beta-glucosidase
LVRLEVEVLEDRCLLSTEGNPAVVPVPGQGNYFLLREAQNASVPRVMGGVLFLGDSITDLFANGLGAQVWNQEIAPLGAANFAISGFSTQNVLAQIASGDLAGRVPRVVVLEIGTNNLTLGQSPEQTAEGIAASVSAIRVAIPQASVVVLGILPRGQSPFDPIRGAVAQTNALIAHLDDGSMVRYADVGQAHLEPDGSISNAVLLDYTHPTALGYAILASEIQPLLLNPRSPLPSPAFLPLSTLPGWSRLTGDWNGDGVPDVATVDPFGDWYFQFGLGGHYMLQYGLPGWVPLAGDWSGAGPTGVGTFDPLTATWYLQDANSQGPDLVFQFGSPGTLPVVGDWSGTGHIGIGVFYPLIGIWALRNSPSPGTPNLVF